MTRIKICGLMNKKDIDYCVQAGVNMTGFVVDYPTPVPWNLTQEEASELIQYVPPFVSTCVVTGGSVEKVLNVVNGTNPNVVQLHYQETLQEISEIAQELQLRGIKTIKALQVGRDGQCNFEITDPVKATRELCKTAISAIIVDSYTEAMPGGTGVMVDLSTFKRIQKESTLPVILAGGLNPTNIASFVNEVHPYAVDVLTGVEEKPNQKDPEKIKQFITNVFSIEFS